MSTALTGNFSAGGPALYRWPQGLARTRIALCQRPGADTEETDVMIYGKICVVSLMLSVNSNELSKV